jgi:hypothetical protein
MKRLTRAHLRRVSTAVFVIKYRRPNSAVHVLPDGPESCADPKPTRVRQTRARTKESVRNSAELTTGVRASPAGRARTALKKRILATRTRARTAEYVLVSRARHTNAPVRLDLLVTTALTLIRVDRSRVRTAPRAPVSQIPISNVRVLLAGPVRHAPKKSSKVIHVT